MKVGNSGYFGGRAHTACRQDTVALKRFRFRELQFAERSLCNVKYGAFWPATDHSPASVLTTNPHPAAGNFHVVTDSFASSLRASDFDVMSDYSAYQIRRARQA